MTYYRAYADSVCSSEFDLTCRAGVNDLSIVL
jgi:hypothetical protein